MTREIEPLVNALIQAVKMERDLFNETSDDYSTEALMLAKERTALCKKALLEARTPPEATGTLDYELPCDVRLPPNTFIGKGCKLSTLLTALKQREGQGCEFTHKDDLSPERVEQAKRRLIDTVIARVKAEAPVEPLGWQPIETAPADTDVLLYCPDRHYTNPERVELGQAKNTKGGSAHSWATHWMPLPSVPSTKSGS